MNIPEIAFDFTNQHELPKHCNLCVESMIRAAYENGKFELYEVVKNEFEGHGGKSGEVIDEILEFMKETLWDTNVGHSNVQQSKK